MAFSYERGTPAIQTPRASNHAPPDLLMSGVLGLLVRVDADGWDVHELLGDRLGGGGAPAKGSGLSFTGLRFRV